MGMGQAVIGHSWIHRFEIIVRHQPVIPFLDILERQRTFVLPENAFNVASLFTGSPGNADLCKPDRRVPVVEFHSLFLQGILAHPAGDQFFDRSEEHTSELQSLMRISYAVFCLKKKKCIYTTSIY